MPSSKFETSIEQRYDDLLERGVLKGNEAVICGIQPAQGKKGPRYLLKDYGGREFIRMNSNSYLGMSMRKEIIEAEEEAVRRFGAGPGAVRFISGTFEPHIILEEKLAEFHHREAAVIFSSAYATVMGTITPLIDRDTIVISDELNHNCIINAVKLSQPKVREIYRHCDMDDLEAKLKGMRGKGTRVMIITDGIFSMRGDCAPLDVITDIAGYFEPEFEEGVVTVVDDSHGVGAFGETGRGTEEYTHSKGVDILVATLGKAFGINGGYVTAKNTIVHYLRETAPFYVYSNPITPSEAWAAVKAVTILMSDEGTELLEKLRRLTHRFEEGLVRLGCEILRSEHPIVPIMVRDTKRTAELVSYLRENGVLTTGLNYPVVPKGDEEIRCQISTDHTDEDLEYVLDVLKIFYTKL